MQRCCMHVPTIHRARDVTRHGRATRLAAPSLLALALLSAPAKAEHLCDDLLVLGRVMTRAQGLAASPTDGSHRAAYAAELALAERRFEDRGSHPAEVGTLARRVLKENRRFLGEIDAGIQRRELLASVQSLAWRSEALALHRVLEHQGCLVPPVASQIASPLPARPENPPEAGETWAETLARIPVLGRLATGSAEDLRGMALVIGLEALALIGLFRLAGRMRLRRHNRRHVCNVPGVLEGHLYCEETMLLDLSRSGCKLRLNDSFAPDRPVLVHVGRRTIPAFPKWSNAHYAGLRFNRRLTEVELSAILAEAGCPQEEGAPPVPALPCHSATCRESCTRYRQMQQLKAQRG